MYDVLTLSGHFNARKKNWLQWRTKWALTFFLYEKLKTVFNDKIPFAATSIRNSKQTQIFYVCTEI